MKKVDYHMHTLCSDGTYTVAHLIDRIRKENITSFSITDHDTVAGISTARAHCKNDLDYVTGVEITCLDYQYEADMKPYSVHLLGYDFDENNKPLQELLHNKNKRENEMFQNLINDLSLSGYKIRLDEIPKSCGSVLQLCDVVKHVTQLYPFVSPETLNLMQSYASKLASVNTPIEEGIAAIKAAGGKAVWAHPFLAYHCLQKETLVRTDVLAILHALIGFGINGLEGDYLAFSAEDRLWLHETASSNGLFCTAGSDFHGFEGRDQMGVLIP